MTDDGRLDMIHRLRALTVQLDLLGAEFAQKHALHPTDLRALIGLLDRERAGEIATPGWLAEHLQLNTASITALVDRLERAGHVRRDRDSDDRRRVILRVTPVAEKLGWDFLGPLFARVSAALESFSEPQLEVVREFLGSMTDAVESARSSEDIEG
ncbi:MarR family winged helix-turn-helix transcriptional regulator [Rhodococcus pyridinivorans]|uniref:MarR family winged helix-turn-helix transcriptional regulator n=1 Tax=Rhodococcus pyridinivorans TaxID=103816 RepID=UPI0036859E5F